MSEEKVVSQLRGVQVMEDRAVQSLALMHDEKPRSHCQWYLYIDTTCYIL